MYNMTASTVKMFINGVKRYDWQLRPDSRLVKLLYQHCGSSLTIMRLWLKMASKAQNGRPPLNLRHFIVVHREQFSDTTLLSLFPSDMGKRWTTHFYHGICCYIVIHSISYSQWKQECSLEKKFTKREKCRTKDDKLEKFSQNQGGVQTQREGWC